MTNDTKRYVGTIMNTQRTYGFIRCEDIPYNVFYHNSTIFPRESLMRGDVVEFSIDENRFGRPIAVNVKLLKSNVEVNVEKKEIE